LRSSFFFLFFVVLIAGCGDSGNKKGALLRPAVVNAVGDRAVDFTLKTFDGGEFSLSSHAGSPVLINFWASWCGPCRFEGPLMEKLYERFKDRGIVFVGVAIQDSEKGSRNYLNQNGWTFPAGPDVGDRLGVAYNVQGIPKTVIIKRDGTVGYIQSGVMPEEYLAGKIEGILGR
jgi:cytochrome c biogenesis protein CcmG/thiol:disulfide interchange protein DsbE